MRVANSRSSRGIACRHAPLHEEEDTELTSTHGQARGFPRYDNYDRQK